MLTAEKNRLRLADRPIQTRLHAQVARLEQELAATNTDLTVTMRESPIWREQEEFLRSVPGMGPVLTTTLFANLPELGTLTRKEVTALAGGTVPARQRVTQRPAHDLGRTGSGAGGPLYGRVVATRKNPVIRSFYPRLCQAVKAKKLALTACMRKVLTILNTMLRCSRGHTVAGGGQSADLIFKTIADPICLEPDNTKI